MLLTAAGVALAASFLGVYLSFFLDSAPAPTIVLLMSAAFVAAFAASVVAGSKAARRQTAVGQNRQA
jgi:manganese/iron transport system permease protein